MPGPVEVRAVHRVSGATSTYAIADPATFVGRAQSMGVQLDDPTVSQCHAYLQVVDGRVYCIDLGSRTGVVWDDGSRRRGWVQSHHVLRIGAFDLQLSNPTGDSTPSPGVQYRAAPGDDAARPVEIEVHSPANGPGVRHPLHQPITLIGRHPNCDVRLLDESVAYFQCALVTTADGLWCVDILTRRGTALNGRMTRLARLHDGDLIELGRVPVLVRSQRQNGFPLVPGGTPYGDLTIAPGKAVESVGSMVAPFQEVMKEFQQCVSGMAQMFTIMQQEQAAMMCEQLRLVQELTKEMRDLRVEIRRESAAESAAIRQGQNSPPQSQVSHPTTAPAPLPTPRLADGPEAESLAGAHNWFLDRLAKMDHPQPPSPRK
jgi:pSer/pThr/pTyr-binding forkhead associated (FHA) protein